MPEPIGLTVAIGPRERSIRVADIARRQGGVISRTQLRECGAGDSTVRLWLRQGRIHRLHPAVYAVGHTVIGIHGRLTAALLYAGREAALSHQTAAYVWDLVRTQPSQLHLTTPRDRKSLPTVTVHRAATRTTRRAGYAVTPLPRTLLDLAATLPFDDLRRAVAEADFRHLLHPAELLSELGRGRKGSKALRAALLTHLPELARANEGVEHAFLLLCERAGLPIPEVNVYVEGFKVDCLWRRERVIVELDSALAHAHGGAVERDRGRDLVLRRAGYAVRRYTWHQVTAAPAAVVADLRAALSPS